MLRNTLFPIVSIVFGLKCNRSYSFAPKIVQKHVEQIKRIPKEEIDKPVNLEPLKDDGLEDCAKNLEKVIGIPVEDTKLMLSYITHPNKKSYTYNNSWKKSLGSWKNIEKGSNLFLKGCGSFDIMSTYVNGIIHHRKEWMYDLVWLDVDRDYLTTLMAVVNHERPKESVVDTSTAEISDFLSGIPNLNLISLLRLNCSAAGRRYLCNGYYRTYRNNRWRLWWLLSVEELQALAYFSEAFTGKGQNYADVLRYLTEILSNGESCQVRNHLINYRNYWNNPDHAGSLDELYKLARGPGYDCILPVGCDAMHPKQLLKNIREQVRQNKLGEDVTYDWLDGGLEDDQKNGLKVLRSLYEIDEAAQQMHNCALSFAGKVERMKSILVLLVNKNTNKALAMGEYNVDSQQWSQISGVCNKQPSDEVIDKFYRYELQTINLWNTIRTL